jgi:hypothetical protein
MTEPTKSIDLLSGRQALLNILGSTVAESFFNNLKTSGFMAGGTPRVTRLGPMRSMTLRPSTTSGVVATSPWSARPQHQHSMLGFSNGTEK